MSLPFFVEIFGFTLPTYTLFLALAVLLSGAWLCWQKRAVSLGALLNVQLGALLGALLLARIVHVVLNAPYFVDHVEEALRLDAGGLDWHGALLGGLAGAALVARWYTPRIDLRPVLDAFAPCVGLLALLTWGGCLAANCAYGLEVLSALGYPPLAIVETADEVGTLAPRLNTYGAGMAFGGTLVLLALLLQWRAWLLYRRFWLMIALLSMGLLLIGCARGDDALRLLGLRADQWLDALCWLFSLWRLHAR
ncbi:MAG: prolipoprotein diacylglyceryl transferase [Chloroflexi bacterium]|nr:prolipoprotein diacylglyceryl transferase [Chloroflexota bacterium]